MEVRIAALTILGPILSNVPVPLQILSSPKVREQMFPSLEHLCALCDCLAMAGCDAGPIGTTALALETWIGPYLCLNYLTVSIVLSKNTPLGLATQSLLCDTWGCWINQGLILNQWSLFMLIRARGCFSCTPLYGFCFTWWLSSRAVRFGLSICRTDIQ